MYEFQVHNMIQYLYILQNNYKDLVNIHHHIVRKFFMWEENF